MREESCPKCKRYGLSPIYHKLDDPKCIDTNFPNNTETTEHLHYKCKCGYDFIKQIDETDD